MIKLKWFTLNVALVIFWLIFTVSLSVWWMVFSLGLVDTLITHHIDVSGSVDIIIDSFSKKRMMLLTEGSVLLLSLLIGGVAFLFLMNKEKKQRSQVERFFATFTHEIKTSLASLRLQGESLEEELKESESRKIAERLVRETVRLELQLENSLFLTQLDKAPLFFEKINLSLLLDDLRYQWPMLQIRVEGDAPVCVDTRAIKSILKNIMQNSLVHGKASQVDVVITQNSDSSYTLDICDNGEGFKGEWKNLGELFARQTASSGSGVGLYLIRFLVKKMGGQVSWSLSENGGFRTLIFLK